MHGPKNIKSSNNISESQMAFNSAFEGLSHCNMFRLYNQPSSGLKEISPGTKNVYFMGSHIVYKIC
jgi:hypothetical protein